MGRVLCEMLELVKYRKRMIGEIIDDRSMNHIPFFTYVQEYNELERLEEILIAEKKDLSEIETPKKEPLIIGKDCLCSNCYYQIEGRRPDKDRCKRGIKAIRGCSLWKPNGEAEAKLKEADNSKAKYGEWLDTNAMRGCGKYLSKCSICGEKVGLSCAQHNYCPNCGATMNLNKEEN